MSFTAPKNTINLTMLGWLEQIRSNDLFLGLAWTNPVESIPGFVLPNSVEWSILGCGLDEFGPMISSWICFGRIWSNDLSTGLAWTNPVEWSLPVRGRAGRPEHEQKHSYYHDTKVKPEAATAVVELLMTGVGTP
jgi:hypothetical protein